MKVNFVISVYGADKMPEIPVPADYPINYRLCKVPLPNRQKSHVFITYLNKPIWERFKQTVTRKKYILTEFKVKGFSLQAAPIYVLFNAPGERLSSPCLTVVTLPGLRRKDRTAVQVRALPEFCPSSVRVLKINQPYL